MGGRLWITSGGWVGTVWRVRGWMSYGCGGGVGRCVAGKDGPRGDEGPDACCAGLAASVMGFSCPMFDCAEEASSNHFFGDVQCGENSSGTLDN